MCSLFGPLNLSSFISFISIIVFHLTPSCISSVSTILSLIYLLMQEFTALTSLISFPFPYPLFTPDMVLLSLHSVLVVYLDFFGRQTCMTFFPIYVGALCIIVAMCVSYSCVMFSVARHICRIHGLFVVFFDFLYEMYFFCLS